MRKPLVAQSRRRQALDPVPGRTRSWLFLLRAPFEQHIRIAIEIVGQALDGVRCAPDLAQRELQLWTQAARAAGNLANGVSAEFGTVKETLFAVQAGQERIGS